MYYILFTACYRELRRLEVLAGVAEVALDPPAGDDGLGARVVGQGQGEADGLDLGRDWHRVGQPMHTGEGERDGNAHNTRPGGSSTSGG